MEIRNFDISENFYKTQITNLYLIYLIISSLKIFLKNIKGGYNCLRTIFVNKNFSENNILEDDFFLRP